MIEIHLPENTEVGSLLDKIDSCFLIETKFISKLFKKFRRQNESQEIPRLRLFMIFKNSSFLIIKNQISKFQKFKTGRLRFPKFQNSWDSDFFEKCFPIFSRDVPWFFLDLIQVILSNKMKKYGLPGPNTSIIHAMLSFWYLMPWNRDFMNLAWRRKIQLRH